MNWYGYAVKLNNGATITGRIRGSSPENADKNLAWRLSAKPDKDGLILLIGVDKSCNGALGGLIRVPQRLVVDWAIRPRKSDIPPHP